MNYRWNYSLEELAVPKQTIFISYARNPDESFAKQLFHDLGQNGFDVWWDRKSMENRGRTFLQELRDAIAECDRFIAIISSSALNSQYVQSEWEHALLFSKAVVPILRSGDFKQIPRDFSNLHCIDFRNERNYNEALEELLRILSKPVAELATIRTTPSLPPNFISRRGEIIRLKEKVLADIDKPIVITSTKQQITSIIGMGGVGKSVLAAALARTANIRRSFIDGIIWLSIGIKPDMTSRLKNIGIAFDDDLKNYVDLDTAKIHLPQVLENKNCLIVLDDVWDVEDAEPFTNALGPRCRLLITTREGKLATALGTQEHFLGELSDADALQLLAQWSDKEVSLLPQESISVARECGNLPFALALCGAMAHDGIPWSDLLVALHEADLSFMETKFPNYPYPNIMKCMKISIDMLSKENSEWTEYYYKLVVFPEKAIPESAVSMMWLYSNGLKEREVRKLLYTLARKSLIKLEGESPNLLISLHDLQYDYLRAVMIDITNVHYQLLSAYQQKCNGSWSNGPNDGYYFEHLAYHLVETGKREELHELLLDFGWIIAKLNATDVNLLIHDYDYMIKEDNSSSLLLIQSALRLSAHVLYEDKEQLRSQIYGRLLRLENQYPEIRQLLERIRKLNVTKLWFRLLTPTLLSPGGHLLWTISGHRDKINSISITSEGKRIVSGSADKTLRIWNLENGNEIQKLEGHTGIVTSIAITPDGQKAVSSSEDGTLRVWDLEGNGPSYILGEYLADGDIDSKIFAVAITPDGQKAVSTSRDHKLRIWDLKSGKLLHTLSDHWDYSMDLAITPNGNNVISASDDKTLIVWDLKTGKMIGKPLVGHKSYVRSVAITPDGKRIVSGSADKTLRIWDLKNGQQIGKPLEGQHTGEISCIAITPDGKKAISGSYDDNHLTVWNLETGEVLKKLEGHEKGISAITIARDGKKAISGSSDKRLIVWNLENGNMLGALRGHADLITSIALTPDSNKAISGSGQYDCTIKVWDLVKEDALDRYSDNHHTEYVSCIKIMPDQRRAISGSADKKIKIWDLESGQLLDTLEGHKEGIRRIMIMPNGKKIVSTSFDGIKQKQELIWDLDNTKKFHEIHGYNILAFTPDGRKAIFESAVNKEEFGILDLESEKETGVKIVHGYYALNILAITPNSQVAISDSEFREKTKIPFTQEGYYDLKVWNLDMGKLNFILKGHTGHVKSVAITPDGKRAVSGSYDKTLRVWDLENGNEIQKLEGHTDTVYLVVITPDGKRAVSTSWDGTLRVWDLERGEQICILERNSAGINNIIPLSNGSIIFSSMNRMLNIWDPEKDKIITSFTGESPIGQFAVREDIRVIVAGEFSGQVHFLRLEGS